MRFFSLLVLLFVSSMLVAQSSALVVVNGGIFGTNNYANVTIQDQSQGITGTDTIRETSVQDLLLDPSGGQLYVAAKDSIVKYDYINGSPGLQRVAATAFGAPSTIKMALAGNKLLVGNWYAPFGQPGPYRNHLRIFNKNTLTYLDSVPEIDKPAKDIIVERGFAYIAQNHRGSNFNDTLGYLAVIDINTNTWVRNDTLATNGEEIGRLFLMGDVIYAINGRSNTISTYNVVTGVKSTVATTVDLQPNGYGKTIVGDANGVVYMPYNDSIGTYNLLNNQPVTGIVSVPLNFGFDVDTLENKIAVTQINFSDQTQNTGTVYNTQGDSLYRFDVGYSPELVAFVLNIMISTDQIADVGESFKLFPNPTTDMLHVQLERAVPLTWIAFDVMGKEVFREQSSDATHTFEVSDLAPGTYFLTALDEKGRMRSRRFVVQ